MTATIHTLLAYAKALPSVCAGSVASAVVSFWVNDEQVTKKEKYEARAFVKIFSQEINITVVFHAFAGISIQFHFGSKKLLTTLRQIVFWTI